MHAPPHLLLSLPQVWARAVYCYVLQTTLSQVSVPLGCCWSILGLRSLYLAGPLPAVCLVQKILLWTHPISTQRLLVPQHLREKKKS